MTDNYQPPKHPWIIIGEDYGSGPWIQIYDPDYSANIHCTPDQAISLGLALMENGLHLKKQGL